MLKLFGLCLLISLLNSQIANGFIVPIEWNSLVSFITLTLPNIHKGTDSRFGFGYRLGKHSDFQVLIELGPQKNTRPLGGAVSERRKTVKKSLEVPTQISADAAVRQLQELYKMAKTHHSTKTEITEKTATEEPE